MKYEQVENLMNYFIINYVVIVGFVVILTTIKISLQIFFLKRFIKGKIIPNVVVFTYSSGRKNQSLPNLDLGYLISQLLLSVIPAVFIYQAISNIIFIFKIMFYYLNKTYFNVLNKLYMKVSFRITKLLAKRIL